MSLGARFLRGLAIATGVLLLILVLIAARFPWERFAPTVSARASQASGIPIEIGGFEFSVGRLGISILATDVHVGWPDAAGLQFPLVAARPAVALDWLRGDPALRLLTEDGPADFDGTVTARRASGRLDVQRAEDLPWPEDPPIAGSFQADLALEFGRGSDTAATLTGGVDVAGADGAIFPPGIPVAIPFDRLAASLVFTPAGLELTPLHVEGPMVSGSVTGTLEPRRGDWGQAALDLSAVVDRVDPGLSTMLANNGVDLSPGRRFSIGGTASAPLIR